ncbi:Ig-like domain-containing protein [Demequina sp. SYSU T00068]|uniref:Ig-like domain-containing protein n=1 Tax=Demequina lignilytica TaxID=3051663 RepID=UPI0026311010|nr:Ig-like domain-containing protein [Demequina sp. SYSU T00068]MDN4491369.1 Ig-like domain-containing protein [Demequina sp. SYSU T00068]
MAVLDRTTSARRRRAGRSVAGILAVVAAVGVVVAPGFDEREAATAVTGVWALQTGDGQRFAHVNTEVGEVDTVKDVDSPSALVQDGDALMVLSAALSSATVLDAGRPSDVAAGTAGAAPTPSGTSAVAAAGDVVAYLAAEGDVLVGRLSDGTAVDPVEVLADAELGGDRGLRADAIAADAGGVVAAFSLARGVVVTAGADGTVTATDPVPGLLEDGDFQLTLAAGRWALLDAASGQLWRQGEDAAVATGVRPTARIQTATSGAEIYLADASGLVRVAADGEARRVFGDQGAEAGAPAAPVEVDGVVYAAWLPAGTGDGTLWSSAGPSVPLDYAGATLAERREPVLRANGDRVILNEERSGWVWEAPSGALIASSQDWEPEDVDAPSGADQEVATEVREPRPPVAEDDSLGARAGRQTRLPVLLNDHDANRDVLTIDPGSIAISDPDAVGIAVAEDGQALVATVAAGASGSVTVQYAVTDGTAEDGLRSEPATVLLTIVGERDQGAPAWCGVPGCVREWPAPQVAPGGTVAVDVLEGWVDPEGDPLYVSGATTASEGASVAASPEGTLVVRAGASTGATIDVEVTVTDARGASAERRLRVAVVGEPRLSLEPVTVRAVEGVRTTVDLAARVTGSRGTVQVLEASADPGEGATVEVLPSGAGIVVTAQEPGDHLVDVTLADGTQQARGTVRVDAIALEDESLATVPLTAFVRPHEDVTVDVLEAVDNPAGRVLLLSDASVEPVDGGRLQAQVVGHGALRLSGTTGDGQAGTIGVVRYTVSDGSGRAATTVRGEVTVVLLDESIPAPPLATDDAITVRAGGQVDVRVLDGDVAAAGAVVALDPDSVVAPEGGGLAFAAGPVVRILAPTSAGTYRIPYSAYILGHPAQRDDAVLTVTVTAGDDNGAPAPRELSGRVASGEEVRIPFDGTGLDPDGDRVVLDAVLQQPLHGSARVSSDGSAIVYTSVPGYSGQDELTYGVVDERGLGATATARIGVVASDADPAPVTYTDFVQVQASEGRRVVVTPLANDVDLTGGELELLDVRPDAVTGSAEEALLAALLEDVALEAGEVAFVVTDQPGTYTFLYSARNATGSTSQGRIVLKTVREPVSDVPVIADTVLTADTRAKFVDGVDVLDGTVAWASGDAGALTVTLWGDVPGATVDGSRISGPLPDRTRIIPFEVRGADFTGAEAVSYGFLRVPGLDDLRLTLRDGAGITVDEAGEASADVSALVAVPASGDLQIDADQTHAGGSRDQARCEAAGGMRVRYVAGRGAPYADTCLVAVRLAGQTDWTVLPIPVSVVPEDPQPMLEAGSLEVSPGGTATFDLSALVRWPTGAAAPAVRIESSYGGQLFVVTRARDTVTVRARDDAQPGRTEAVTVSLPAYPDAGTRVLSLVVGPAPSELPKGGTVSVSCSQAAGGSCVFDVVGVGGEVNPLPDTALEVVSVTPAGACAEVELALEGTTAIRATWTDDAPGGECEAVFAVRDAQGRVSSAERAGSLTLDLQGFPAAPAGVTQEAYGPGTLTLAVQPGAAARAHPALTGFDVLEGGVRVATCTPSGTCTPISGLADGDRHTYAVHAVNAVGRSRTAATAVAWSYTAPEPVTVVSWSPTVTSGDGGRIDLVLDVGDPAPGEVRLESGTTSQSLEVRGPGEQTFAAVAVGSNEPATVTLTPVSGIEPPPGAQASGAATTFTAHGIGRPTIASATATAADGAAEAVITVATRAGGAGAATWVGTAVSGTCRADTEVPDGTGSVDLRVAVAENSVTTVTVCAESRFDGDVYGRAPDASVTVTAFTDPGAPVLERGYQADSACVGTGSSCSTALLRDPQWRALGARGAVLMYRGSDGVESETFGDVLAAGRPVEVIAYWCIDLAGGDRRCSEQTTAVTAESGPPYRPTVALPSCTVGEEPAAVLGASPADVGLVYAMLDGAGAPTTDPSEMRSVTVTATFVGALAGMAPWTSAPVTCDGAPAEASS